MAAVTQTGTPSRHVLGDVVSRVFNFSGASGTTLSTGMQNILYIGLSAGTLITAIAQSKDAFNNVVLTITSSAPMTGETIFVLARVG